MKKPLFLASIIISGACSTAAPITDSVNGFMLPSSDGAVAVSAISLAEQISESNLVSEVLRRNPSSAQAASAIIQARAQLELSKSAFRPHLNLKFEYMHADAPSAFLFKTIDSRRFMPGTDFNNPGSFNNYETKLELGYNLYAGGAYSLAQQMAETGVDLAKLQQDLVKQQLGAATLQTLLNIEGARQQFDVSAASVELIDAQITDTQKHIDAGTTLRSDLLSLQARRSEARDLNLQAKHSLKLAEAAMATLLNISPLDLPEINSSLDDLRQVYLGDLSPDSVTAVKLAIAQRPETKSATLAANIAKLNVNRVAAGAMPQINLFGQSWFDQSELGFSNAEQNYSVGFMVDYNLFDGGALVARRLQARAKLSAAISAAQTSENQIASETRIAFLDLRSAESRLEVAKAGVEQAAEGLRLVQVQYENNVTTITRFLEAEQMNTQAQLRLVQAQLGLHSAQIELTRATSNFKDL